MESPDHGYSPSNQRGILQLGDPRMRGGNSVGNSPTSVINIQASSYNMENSQERPSATTLNPFETTLRNNSQFDWGDVKNRYLLPGVNGSLESAHKASQTEYPGNYQNADSERNMHNIPNPNNYDNVTKSKHSAYISPYNDPKVFLENRPVERGEISMLSDYELNEKLKEINKILYGNENGAPSSRINEYSNYLTTRTQSSQRDNTQPVSPREQYLQQYPTARPMFTTLESQRSEDRGRTLSTKMSFGSHSGKVSFGSQGRSKSELRGLGMPEDSDWVDNMYHRSSSEHKIQFGKGGSETSKNMKIIDEAPERRFEDIPSRHNLTLEKSKSFSKADALGIYQILSPELIKRILDDPDTVIIEGELLKYRPGLHFNYQKRWVQVTRKEIRYYKTRWLANAWEARPIYAISFDEIRAAFRVNMKLPKKIKIEGSDKGPMKWDRPLNHFEIFTYENDNLFQFKNAINVDPKVLKYGPEGEAPGNTTVGSANSTGYKRSNTQFNLFQVNKGHLMCAPNRTEYRKYPYGTIDPYAPYDVHITNAIIKPKSYATSNNYSFYSIGLDLQEPIKEKASSISVKEKPKGSILSKQSSVRLNQTHTGLTTVKEQTSKPSKQNYFGPNYGYKKTVEDLTTWSNREQEWWYAEKRLLFASTSPKEVDIWISVIAWVIEQNL